MKTRLMVNEDSLGFIQVHYNMHITLVNEDSVNEDGCLDNEDSCTQVQVSGRYTKSWISQCLSINSEHFSVLS